MIVFARGSSVVVSLFSVLLAVGTLAGCTTKSKAKADSRSAFLAGQQEAMARVLLSRGPTITVAGQVRSPIIPWTEDLTLAKAIIAAGYLGSTDPKTIRIIRNGQEIRMDAKQLLTGQDVPLQSGDIVDLRQ